MSDSSQSTIVCAELLILPRLPFVERTRSDAIQDTDADSVVNSSYGAEKPWLLKDLRKTCATYYDEHVPESSIEILGHSVGGVTYRHYAHRAPLAFRAIMTLPQPSAFAAMVNGFDGQCPCCRREFADGGA